MPPAPSTPKSSSSRSRKLRLPRVQFGRGEDSAEISAVTTYYLILIPALLLGAFGLIMGFSAQAVSFIAEGTNPYAPFLRTVAIAIVALVVATLCAYLKPKFWDRMSVTIFLIALVMQLALIPFGIGKGGNTNWLPIPGTNQVIQPSEFLKLATCLILARLLSNAYVKIDNWKHLVLVGIPAVAALGAVMVGDDMGTALVFVALTLGALWVADVPGRYFAMLFLAIGAAAVFFVSSSASRMRRVIEFLPGFGTPPSTSAPTQTDHGLWALGAGGLTGLGPGASREKWNYLQEAHTDFILAIIGEEFGLIGTISLLVIFAVLVYGILQLSANAQSAFIRISAGAVATWFIVQAFINIGTVTGLAPVIGVPFPLVSYGGSSFLFTAMAIGVLLSFARAESGIGAKGRLSAETGGRDPRTRRPRRTRTKAAGRTEALGHRPRATGGF